MTDVRELKFPEDLKYAKDHEWARAQPDRRVRVGVSDYAQDKLGDITYVELPSPGDVFKKGEEFGNLESVKTVAELYMPISGEIVAVNGSLADSPGLVNQDPYGEGWLVDVQPEDPGAMEDLMSGAAYVDMLLETE
ncbi:MAG: glycine cleavage system protein GcvH [Pseudomonadota bacterium]